MKTGIKVGDLMTRSFVWVSPETNLHECAKEVIKKRVGSLIIKEKDRLKGILTEKDILWAVVKKSDLTKIPAKDLMKRKVVTVKPNMDIVDALNRIKKKRVRRLPVVEKKRVIGMLTVNDILRIDPGLFELISETVKIKEQTEKLKKGKILEKKSGVCEECGQVEMLSKDNGLWVCGDCYSSK